MSETSGDEVGREFQRGSPEAVQAVRERVRRIIAFRGYRMPAEDKQDVEQEVMTQIWQAANRDGFDPGSRFWGFVEVVTARRSIDWLRSRTTRNRETTLNENLRETSAGPLRVTLARERIDLAHTALAQLAKPCRDLVYLRVGLGKSYGELAELLGKSEGALRVKLHRCIAHARQIIAPSQATEETNKRNRTGR